MHVFNFGSLELLAQLSNCTHALSAVRSHNQLSCVKYMPSSVDSRSKFYETINCTLWSAVHCLP